MATRPTGRCRKASHPIRQSTNPRTAIEDVGAPCRRTPTSTAPPSWHRRPTWTVRGTTRSEYQERHQGQERCESPPSTHVAPPQTQALVASTCLQCVKTVAISGPASIVVPDSSKNRPTVHPLQQNNTCNSRNPRQRLECHHSLNMHAHR